MKIVYMSDNGKIFETETACKEYEKQIDEMKSYKDMLFELVEKCEGMACDDCPFAYGKYKKCAFGIQPVEWEL